VTFRLQRLAVVGGKLTKCSGCPLLDGAGLTRESTTANIHQDVVFGGQPQCVEWSFDRCDVCGVEVQVVVTWSAIDGDGAVPGYKTNAGNRGFAATSAPLDDGITAHVAEAEG